MFRPLAGCTLAGPLKAPAPALAPVAASLLYQANALGLQLDRRAETFPDEGLSVVIETKGGARVTSKVTGWPDPSGGTLTEHLAQAACGLMSVHGRASGGAKPLGLDYVSSLAAVLALQGGFAATIGQLRGMGVTHSATSLAAAALLSVGQYVAAASAPDAPEKIMPGSTSATERPPFVSADGVVFELETLDAEPWRKFWAEAGVAADIAGKGWNAFLLRYARAIAPLPSALVAALAAMPYAGITDLCARTGMSICRVRPLTERAQDDDLKHTLCQGPWTFGSTDAHPATPMRPGSELPLNGVMVIESCRRIQGPLAGHLLAQLGAHVLRIEPPGGDPLRAMPPLAGDVSARYDAINRLKPVREIDIKSAKGQAEIRELARDADVFLHNWAPGKAAELSLDHPDLAKINPSLIYAYAGGWGPGVDCAAPGTDFMAQAYSGIASRVAESSGTRGGSLFTVLDVLGGAVAAQGVTIALLSRLLDHRAARVDTSLLGAATLLCASELEAEPHPREASPDTPTGAKPMIKGVFSTREGLIAVDCHGEEVVSRMMEAAGLDGPLDSAKIDADLRAAFAGRGAAEWVDILAKYAVPAAVVVEDLADLAKDSRICACLDPRSYTQIKSPWRFE